MKKFEIILFCLTAFSAIGYIHIISYEYTNFETRYVDKIEEIPIFIFANDELTCVKEFDRLITERNSLIDFALLIQTEEFLSLGNVIESTQNDFVFDLLEKYELCGNNEIWCKYSKYYKKSCDDLDILIMKEVIKQ